MTKRIDYESVIGDSIKNACTGITDPIFNMIEAKIASSKLDMDAAKASGAEHAVIHQGGYDAALTDVLYFLEGYYHKTDK